MDYLQISNLPIMWLLCGVTVFIAALQAILFIRSANKAIPHKQRAHTHGRSQGS